MISQLRGNVIHKDLKYIVVDVAGVGYKISTSAGLSEKTIIGKEITIWTHLAVREDAMDLYGFMTKDELDFFELLISSVSGVGPKSALGILNLSSLSSLRRAIASGNSDELTKVSGIGRKTAEKIVLELRDKMEKYSETDNTANGDFGDAMEALKALGYSEKQSRDALKKAGEGDTSEVVKKALKILNQSR